MPIAEWLPYLIFANTAIAILTAIYTWVTARSRGNSEKLEALEKDVERLRQRVATLEQEMRHLPAKDEVHTLQLGMTEIGGSVATLNKSHEALLISVRRIEDFLLKPGGTHG
ncbi:MAG: DUF2730 family protein [Nitratireductor sp.]|nr:DUF2730 family protein [Nitratireductor sp.]